MTKFYIGSPCKYGHQSGKRYTRTKGCVECSAAREVDPTRKAWKAQYKRREDVRARDSEYSKRPGVSARHTRRRRTRLYGVTPTMFNFTLAGQNFCCGKCGADRPGSKNDWAADHCHETGRFRGVLCHTCNQGLGKLGDNVEGLLEAIEYIVGEALPTNLTKQILRMDGRPKHSPPIEPNESRHTNWSAGLL